MPNQLDLYKLRLKFIIQAKKKGKSESESLPLKHAKDIKLAKAFP